MAEQKAIRTQLKEGVTEVTHEDQKANFELPEHLAEAYPYLDDKTALVKHFDEHGVLLEMLHQGISQEFVNVRAKARPNKTKQNPNPSLDTAEQRRKAKDHRPGTLPAEDRSRLTKREKAKKSLIDLGFSEEQAEAAIQAQGY